MFPFRTCISLLQHSLREVFPPYTYFVSKVGFTFLQASFSYVLTLTVLNFWKLTSYYSLKHFWSGMGEVVPARTSPTLHLPSLPTVHQLSLKCLHQLIHLRSLLPHILLRCQIHTQKSISSYLYTSTSKIYLTHSRKSWFFQNICKVHLSSWNA